MTENMGVAEVKRRFSEVLSRVELRGERVVVRRHGRAVAVIMSPTEADEEPVVKRPRRGLAAGAGAWEEHDDVDGFLEEIRAGREGASDRVVEPLE